jgi:hypothetical protein
VDVKSWLKDRTKKRGDVLVEMVFPPEQPVSSRHWLIRLLLIAFVIGLAALAMEYTTLKNVIAPYQQTAVFVLGCMLLLTCLYLLRDYIQLGIAVIFRGIYPSQALHMADIPTRVDDTIAPETWENASVYLADDGELVIVPGDRDNKAKTKPAEF